MADIRLKYNQARRGIWSVEIITLKDIPKDINFGWRIGVITEDYRRVIGRLLNHEKYKNSVVYYKDTKDEMCIVGWFFKVTSIGNEEIFYIRLSNQYNSMVRGTIYVSDDYKRTRKLNRLMTNTIPNMLKTMLKEELRYIEPIPFEVKFKIDGHTQGFAIELDGEREELRLQTYDGRRMYDDGSVGDFWRF